MDWAAFFTFVAGTTVGALISYLATIRTLERTATMQREALLEQSRENKRQRDHESSQAAAQRQFDARVEIYLGVLSSLGPAMASLVTMIDRDPAKENIGDPIQPLVGALAKLDLVGTMPTVVKGKALSNALLQLFGEHMQKSLSLQGVRKGTVEYVDALIGFVEWSAPRLRAVAPQIVDLLTSLRDEMGIDTDEAVFVAQAELAVEAALRVLGGAMTAAREEADR
jgi:hypothetical protein